MTLRELVRAAEAKRRYDWDHTADLMSLIATANFPGRFTREDFHPLRERVIPEHLLDDPAAEYERLKEKERREGKK